MAAVPSVSGLGGWRPWGRRWATTGRSRGHNEAAFIEQVTRFQCTLRRDRLTRTVASGVRGCGPFSSPSAQHAFFRATSSMQMTMRHSRLCTRIISLIASYAIVLHGLLIALAGFPLAASASGNDDTSRLEICLHEFASGATLPLAPGAPASGDVHCKFCIGQAHSMALALTSCGVQFNFTTPSAPIWFVLNQDTAGAPRYLHKQPRGPPAAT